MTEKTTERMALHQAVQRVAEAAMEAVVSYLATDAAPTAERAHEIIDEVLTEHNCESPEGHIVASGVQATEPHEKGSGLIARGVPIVIDIFPRSPETGYWGDITRTVCLGVPTPEVQKMYDTVLAAQKLALSLVDPGVAGKAVHEAVKDFFTKEGYATTGMGKEFRYAEGFVHGLGHGVGQKIHATPHLGERSTDVLSVGDVITIEPGLYYPSIGGVRIEDMIVVTETGYENLTSFSKEFRI